MEKPHLTCGFFVLSQLKVCAHENHEQGIIVSSRVLLQPMRMMPVIPERLVGIWQECVFDHEEFTTTIR
jgi:hypothetical protein